MRFGLVFFASLFITAPKIHAQFIGGLIIPTVDTTVSCGFGSTVVLDIINPMTGKIWMDRNMGALQVATSLTDTLAFGDLYQWGRGSDGHQCRNSPITNMLSTSNQPGNNSFIISTGNATTSPFADWRTPQNVNLWQGVSGINNPCPTGYRLPSNVELNNERLSWVQPPINSNNTYLGAFATPLKFTAGGSRNYINGFVSGIGTFGAYWSSTISTTRSNYLYFSNSLANVVTNFRAYGFSVRCIKN